MKTVAFELQPCCGKRSGIGLYAYELACRMQNTEELSFSGQVFNFLGRNDNSASLSGVSMPVKESRLMPYGVYRRIWNLLPFSYETMSGSHADLSVFFNYIVPPRMSGKVIDTICDMTYLRYPETMNAKNLRRITHGIQSSVERSERIITISEFSKREIMELLHVKPEMISVVPCAPSLTMHTADFTETAIKYGITKPYVLYVGTIEPRKNLSRLIRAFDLLKRESEIDYQLILAGGEGWNNEEIHREAEQAVCSEDICFTGYVSAQEKNVLYQHAAVLAFPSLYEGFGMPPLEAMYWECPVICSDVASLPEIAGDAACFVDPMDETEIAQGLFHVLTDSGYAKMLIKRGQNQLRKYTWEASAEKLLRTCQEVLE